MKILNRTALIIAGCLAIALAGFTGTSYALADTGWNDCREGRVNCTYPGHCPDYTDTNSDGICDHSQSQPQTAASTATATTVASADISSSGQTVSGTGAGGSRYYLLPVLLVTGLLYGLSYLLAARGAVRLAVHRKIWNVILLITFFVSAVLGLILVLEIDYNTDIALPFSTLFWHVEAGIVMGAVAALHIGWHWRYFQKMLKPAA
jgi:hypothetical protein